MIPKQSQSARGKSSSQHSNDSALQLDENDDTETIGAWINRKAKSSKTGKTLTQLLVSVDYPLTLTFKEMAQMVHDDTYIARFCEKRNLFGGVVGSFQSRLNEARSRLKVVRQDKVSKVESPKHSGIEEHKDKENELTPEMKNKMRARVFSTQVKYICGSRDSLPYKTKGLCTMTILQNLTSKEEDSKMNDVNFDSIVQGAGLAVSHSLQNILNTSKFVALLPFHGIFPRFSESRTLYMTTKIDIADRKGSLLCTLLNYDVENDIVSTGKNNDENDKKISRYSCDLFVGAALMKRGASHSQHDIAVICSANAIEEFDELPLVPLKSEAINLGDLPMDIYITSTHRIGNPDKPHYYEPVIESDELIFFESNTIQSKHALRESTSGAMVTYKEEMIGILSGTDRKVNYNDCVGICGRHVAMLPFWDNYQFISQRALVQEKFNSRKIIGSMASVQNCIYIMQQVFGVAPNVLPPEKEETASIASGLSKDQKDILDRLRAKAKSAVSGSGSGSGSVNP